MKDQDQPAPLSTPTPPSPSPSTQPFPKTYKISTLCYNLSVLYQQQKNSLTITIEDYSTWAVYTQQYGQQDIGKSIDRKMDICDLFLGFDAASQADVGRRLMMIKDQKDIDKEDAGMVNLFKKYREDMKEYTDYKFGEIVKNGDIMCYKVDKNGIVTVYMNYLDRRTKKQTIISSTLTLPLSHTFTPEQKFLHETKLQHQDLIFKFISYIKHQSAQKQSIGLCLKKIEEENKVIREENIENKNKLLKMESNFQHFRKKVAFLGVKFQSCARIYREEGIQWKVGIQKKIGKMEKDSKEREREGIQGVKKEVLQLVELFQSQRAQNLAEQSKLKQQLLNIKSKLYPLQLTSLSQPNTSLFQIHNLTLKYIGPDSTPTSYIFNHQIPKIQQYSLKLKLIHSPITWLMFGIIALPSTQPSIIPPSSYQSSNIICCYNTGEIYPGGKNCGIGFKQGETIELEVNLLERVVRWKVQGQLRCQYRGGMLEEKGKIFRPWVEMYYSGDVVEICQ